MACSRMPAVLVTVGVYLLLQPPALARATPGDPASSPARRHVLSPLLRARLEPYSGDILIDDADDQLDLGKRFDDYGHMSAGKLNDLDIQLTGGQDYPCVYKNDDIFRFGKRGEPEEKFDDYGHMRFGRAHV